ncbi:Fc.00g072760.m01.CDS01 [Cosmosporella sp. VM-42]
MATEDVECPAYQTPPNLAQGKGVKYDIPIFKNEQQEVYELEALLLAWTLFLYRQNHGEHVQYSWGLSEIGTFTSHTFEVDTSRLPWDSADSISTALGVFRSYLQQQLQRESQVAANRYLLYFNDELAPNGSSSHVNEEGNFSVAWGNVQLQAVIEDEGLWLRPFWREPSGASFLANHFAHSLIEILNTTMTDITEAVSSVIQLGDLDQSVIWGWNKEVPPTTNACIHQLILEQVRQRPGAPAICSWDGDFTYKDVDRHSTLLAHHLISLGLQVGHIVPLCFEKSKWTTIAVMAVIKAGGAFVLMDPSQPFQRRQTMATQVGATLLLTSKDQAPYSVDIAPGSQTVIVDEDTLVSLADSVGASQWELPDVPPDSLLYIIFTSGSTGTPKGVMISHTTYTTSALARSTAIGYSSTSRSLDFTSYAFDVSVDSILSTLIQGGCLCIPTDDDRVNDLSGAIRRLRVNMVNITPSVARILDPDIIPSLRSLGIGGESCSAGDISIWGQHTRIVVGYGPAECTIGCTVNPSAAGKPYVSIGSGTGAVIWLVNPDNHDELVPVGSVGELLIEGPIVGQGYLGDPEKTAAAFINDPAFLLAGGGGIPGRRGRLYKTGDLVRYDPDGECGFVFVGRKDTQIKLRGQRVELGEIEYHIKNLLPAGSEVIAEILAPRSQNKESMLVAFIANREGAASAGGDSRQVEFSPILREAVESLNEKLSVVLPVYMVPAVYIGLSKIPMLVSGKTDRKSLRSLGADLPLATQSSTSATQESSTFREPTSDAELFLRDSWCRLLGLESNLVSTTHNFFMLGGESVLAMKLVPLVREWGFALSVADVFNHPVLSDMARSMQRGDINSKVDMKVPPFSLLSPKLDREALRSEAAEHCGCDEASIEDIYPCAPMQEIHMAFYTRSKDNYIAQRIADIPESSSVSKLKSAWDTVFRECAVLRTRIVEFKQQGFLQVVVDREIQWQESNTSLREFLEKDAKEPMSPGEPLSRFSIVHDESLNQRFFVWTAHHAIYDGWSTDLIVEHAKAAYKGLNVSRTADFKHFVRYLADPSTKKASEAYWRAQLEGATSPQFPSLPSRSHIPEPDSLAERFIAVDQSVRSDFTIATVIRAAWALLASQYSMSDDVVFGETFTGRTIPVPGAELIEGPILATVPVRVRLDRTTSVQEFLRSIQEQSVIRAAHEHLGIQHIRRLSPDAQIACEVTMGLVIQPKEPDETSGPDDLPSFRVGDAALEALHFNSYPLMLACSLQPDGFRLLASFDSNLLSQSQVQRVLSQFQYVVSQLRGDQARPLNDITCLSEDELEEIWEVNRVCPLSPQDISSALVSGDKYPIIQYARWVVHPTNENLLMPVGTVGELLLEGAVIGESVDALDAPEWLKLGSAWVPGRNGRLYRTGDLVKYADDMSLVFLGRKETMTSIDGHVINLSTTNLELKRLLPETTNASSQLIVPRGSSNQTPIVVAFIQETPPQDARMVDLGIDGGDRSLPLSQAISVELATAIIGLNNAMAETMPPYAIPSICIPVAKVTDHGEPVDVTFLNGIAEHVTLSLVMGLRRSFTTLRHTIAESVRLTTKERVLRSQWSKFLNLEETKLSLDDNFFRLGGDSIVAMRMVSALRQAGYRLSVASIFQNMQLRDMANALVDIPTESKQAAKEYSHFSLLKLRDVDRFLSDDAQPLLSDSSWTIKDVIPVTDPQQRDVRATVSAPRSSVQYNMLYFDHAINTSRLLESFAYLVSRHPILRTVFIQRNGQILQVVLENMDVPVTEQTIEGSIDASCKEIAEADIDIDSAFVFGTPFLHLFILRGDKENALMIRMSHAQYDGVSLPELLRQLELRYRGIAVPASPPFETYMHHLHSTKTENVSFWRKLLRGSSPTEIITPARCDSKTAFMTSPVDITGSSPDTTLPILLTAAWARVMAQFLNVSDVTFGSIVSGRDVDISGVDGIMGPCYQYMPVRVKFEDTWTATELLAYVRTQYLEGSQRAGLGFQELVQECTDWPAATNFYGSFVNHLNREYFDTIPFADTQCRVDYTIPHPEPSNPPRVVSYVEFGKTFIGIEADEDRREFWEARLAELAVSIEGFVKNPQDVL